jgi:hypothetical protein
MFKYISTILSQFTQAQRIIALILLLFSIVVMTIAPSFISSITLDREELMQNLENKETRIKALESEIDTLSNRIRQNQRLCTDQITQREQKFIEMLNQLKGELQQPRNPTAVKMLESQPKDGVSKKMVIIEPDVSNLKALRMIDNMKRTIKSEK